MCPGTDPSDYDNRYWNGRCNAIATQFSPGLLFAQDNLAGGVNASAFPAINFPAVSYTQHRAHETDYTISYAGIGL